MTRRSLWLATCVVLLCAGAAALTASMQGPQGGAAPPAVQQVDPTAPTTTDAQEAWEREFGDFPTWRYRRNVFRLGQDYTVRVGDRARDVAVVLGTARVAGRIDGDLVVVLGTAEVASTAVINGSLIVVGGDAQVAQGALVRRDVVSIGTDMQLPMDFVIGGEHILIGTRWLGDSLSSIVPWLSGGLLWGRPLVPSLGWVWSIVGLFLIVYLLVNLLLHEPVRATADVLQRRPFGAFMVGLLMLLLWAPISALLAVSVIGIIVIPFFLCALVVAAVAGRVGVFRWIGDNVIAPDDPGSRVQALRSFIIGFALITLVYMVPLLGLVTWGLIGVFGFGAAVMAFLSAWRKETPKSKPPKGPDGAGDAHGPSAQTLPQPGESIPGSDAPAAGASLYAPLAAAVPSEQPPVYAPPPSAPPVPPPTPSPAGRPPLAGFLERAGAFGLDLLTVAVLHQALEGWFLPRNGDSFLPLLLIYFIAFWAWKGTTVGGIVLKLKIVKVSGQRLDPADAIVRGLTGVLSFAAVGIGMLWILKDPQRQGWHDKAVGTVVVKEATVI